MSQPKKMKIVFDLEKQRRDDLFRQIEKERREKREREKRTLRPRTLRF